MKMNWAHLLSRRFFFFVCFPSILIAKKDLSLMMFVFGCVQKLASKKASFLAPKVLSLGAWLRPSWKKMRPEKWRPGSVRKSLRLTQKRFFEPWTLELLSAKLAAAASKRSSGRHTFGLQIFSQVKGKKFQTFFEISKAFHKFPYFFQVWKLKRQIPYFFQTFHTRCGPCIQ